MDDLFWVFNKNLNNKKKTLKKILRMVVDLNISHFSSLILMVHPLYNYKGLPKQQISVSCT